MIESNEDTAFLGKTLKAILFLRIGEQNINTKVAKCLQKLISKIQIFQVNLSKIEADVVMIMLINDFSVLSSQQ